MGVECAGRPLNQIGMRAMILEQPGKPLVLRDVSKPKRGPGQLLVRVKTCAVCRTDLHVVDGELPNPKLPLILGHQIVGRLEEIRLPVRGRARREINLSILHPLIRSKHGWPRLGG